MRANVKYQVYLVSILSDCQAQFLLFSPPLTTPKLSKTGGIMVFTLFQLTNQMSNISMKFLMTFVTLMTFVRMQARRKMDILLSDTWKNNGWSNWHHHKLGSWCSETYKIFFETWTDKCFSWRKKYLPLQTNKSWIIQHCNVQNFTTFRWGEVVPPPPLTKYTFLCRFAWITTTTKT